MSTRKYLHLVTGSYFRSRKKDEKKDINRVIIIIIIMTVKLFSDRFVATFAHTLHHSVCYRCQVIGDGVFNVHRSGFMHASIA